MEHQKLIETSCTIMDLQGVGLSQFLESQELRSRGFPSQSELLPRNHGQVLHHQLPILILDGLELGQAVVDEKMVKKIMILDSSYQKTLLQQIPAESLPKTLKGKCECAGGCSMSDAGPWKDAEVVAKAEAWKAGPATSTPLPLRLRLCYTSFRFDF
ncbi:hypothetical protein Pst134EA_011125 [Puccinia striiformis f. sp. tritici]|uniref:hypothetical protein n=1 Tax=Puccinia striiformis f. sp. tritici TaxID=168172 RepID=UPI0020075792|nr:hypothetical protein Pst134EA_011125 [Puccinia striiformis f. sp. tritici]KAH9467482.1 hypothetical protein Pst134EA_011125 [Puccinia striiformis f. sp. tritici]